MANVRFTGANPDRLGLLADLIPAIGLVISFVVFAPALEDRAVEWRFRSRPPTVLDTSLALVGLDERTALALDPGGGTPKPYLTRLVRVAAHERPSVIALDFRVGPRELAEPGGREFARVVDSVSHAGIPVVLPALLARHGDVSDVVYAPSPADFGAVHAGYVSFAAGPEAGGPLGRTGGGPVLPRLPYFDRLGSGDLAISFPALVVALHLGYRPPIDPEVSGTVSDSVGVRLVHALGLAPPDATGAETLTAARRPRHIDYAGHAPYGGVLPYYASAADLLGDPTTVAQGMRGHAVLIASVYPSPDGFDEVRTPYGRTRGGIVLLHAMDTLLRRPRLWVAPGWVGFLLVVGSVTFVVWAWSKPTFAHALGLTVGFCLAFVLVSYVFGVFGYFLPMVWPMGAVLFAFGLLFIMGRPTAHETREAHAVLEGGRSGEPAEVEPEGQRARLPPEQFETPRRRGSVSIIGGLLLLGLWGLMRRK